MKNTFLVQSQYKNQSLDYTLSISSIQSHQRETPIKIEVLAVTTMNNAGLETDRDLLYLPLTEDNMP